MGQLPRAVEKRKFILVGTDYFTKWIKAETLAKITQAVGEMFAWNNAITRFGVPFSIIFDNRA